MNFILLYECKHDDFNGTKYYVYEIFSTTFYALTPNDSEEVQLQKILWSPASYDSYIVNNNNNDISLKKVLPSSRSKAKTIEKSKLSQAIAFIHDFDIYYKPKIHSDLVIRVTTNGEFDVSMRRLLETFIDVEQALLKALESFCLYYSTSYSKTSAKWGFYVWQCSVVEFTNKRFSQNCYFVIIYIAVTM